MASVSPQPLTPVYRDQAARLRQLHSEIETELRDIQNDMRQARFMIDKLKTKQVLSTIINHQD